MQQQLSAIKSDKSPIEKSLIMCNTKPDQNGIYKGFGQKKSHLKKESKILLCPILKDRSIARIKIRILISR
jgi:hypothetical protein